MLMRGATLARLVGGQGGFANADLPFHSGCCADFAARKG
ncbi:hypothetical protein F753_08460 [Stutzerimonas chloritidismutans AW-1]|jgi:hypothetical protein|uniref:Uncharacterized protein n=1 Tax=Stutzerimonas chloritidismutans AW-1 TaxID=1263865 RepID=V4PUD0_STUCH|nr:hypothetical protein F753_08460 [Stutzerimonas chloritidismutans AW-1]|tara:strand:- start:361 stop:477 length:117 start_codon:yes stop_codon:yes gene_type:complete